jgi:hypothetical protein
MKLTERPPFGGLFLIGLSDHHPGRHFAAPFDASNLASMNSASSASALSMAAAYLADFKSAGSPPPHIVSRLEGTEIKLSTLPTAGPNGVAGGSECRS